MGATLLKIYFVLDCIYSRLSWQGFILDYLDKDCIFMLDYLDKDRIYARLSWQELYFYARLSWQEFYLY